ncbi:ROK family transcriptional regulator [Actinocatenispora sera]|uniref:ROK family transcriptional regulator n=1 Tax=Actinocatenispora sera TaxID=390989 RepID=UPI00068D7A23|nr:ROK family transcriptional regulator [Actinocatenispora sera]
MAKVGLRTTEGAAVAEGLAYQVLCLLREHGPLSRVELADRLAVPRARLLSELTRLTETDRVREAGPAASRGGRRSTLIELSPRHRYGAVDLGATSVRIEVTDRNLDPVAAVEEAVDIRSGPRPVLRVVTDLLEKLRAEGAYRQLDGLGVGLPGPVSFRDGVPVSPPIMPGWDGFPVREMLAHEHNCPVVVDNDVNIMAIGEGYGGVARSVDDFLFVKLGTGIGCGIHLGGEVFRGKDGCAGDIGHMQVVAHGPVCACGNTGCLEAVFGGAALARDAVAAARAGRSEPLAARLAEHGTLSAYDVGQTAAAGDATSVALIRAGGAALGGVLASLVSFVNPSMIVIGGGLAGLGHRLLAEVRAVVYGRSLPLATGNLPLVVSELGERAGALGAAKLASDLVFRQS